MYAMTIWFRELILKKIRALIAIFNHRKWEPQGGFFPTRSYSKSYGMVRPTRQVSIVQSSFNGGDTLFPVLNGNADKFVTTNIPLLSRFRTQ